MAKNSKAENGRRELIFFVAGVLFGIIGNVFAEWLISLAEPHIKQLMGVISGLLIVIMVLLFEWQNISTFFSISLNRKK